MKLLLILCFTIGSQITLAQEDCDQENNLEKIARGITYPNCNTPENIRSLKGRNPVSVCNECKKDFELIHGKKIEENPNHLRKEFFHSAFSEYKKNLTNNLINAVKIKTLYPTSSKLSKSIKSCQLKTKEDFSRGCKSPAALQLLNNSAFFKDLSAEIGNEAAKFVSEKPIEIQPTLLNRRSQQCHIPEKDIALYSSATYEEALSGEILEFLKGIDPKKYKSVTDLFSSDEFIENFGDKSDLKVSLGSHPLISGHLKSVDSLVSFAKKVPSPSAAKDLRSILYSTQNGDKFDSELAANCEKSFKSLQDSICSANFEEGKLFVEPLNNFAKLEVAQSLPIEDKLSSTESLVDTNIKLLQLCENKDSPQKMKLTGINMEIAADLNDEQKSQSLSEFNTSKYNSEIGTLANALCSMTPANCVKGTLTCSIYEKYTDAAKTIVKPSEFANTEANELIRAMIGDTSKVQPDAKLILIANGILPKEDGKFVEKPEIKETQEEFFAKMPAQKITSGSGKTSQSTASTSQAARTQTSTNNLASNSNTPSSAPSGDMSDISDLVRGSTEDIKDIQDEIKRRLGNLPSTKPATIEDAKKIARDTFKNKGRKITPYQEQALAERMMQPSVPNSVSASNANIVPNSPSVSNTETQSEKWRNGLKDKALMGMQGAQQVLANDASTGRGPANVEAKPKDLTKVALNIAEDPKVKLSDIFSNKIDQNDPETQLLKVLLKSKNNFLLQIKDMNFKIVFDEKNNFNVLLESGDRAEAERMRPQLEIFLKRLKS